MPVTARRYDSEGRTKILVDDLYAILRHPGSSHDEPLIVENQIDQTKSVHVVVIWDRLESMSPADRSKVILDAYAKAKKLRGATITVAMGLTSEQALRMGFLPFSIVSTRRTGDKASLQRVETAMADVGGTMLKIGSSTQLRFPTLAQAEDAYRKLSQEIPGPYWAIVHEQSSGD